MNAQQDFIDARRGYIVRAVERARLEGHADHDLIVMLGDSQADRDTWPSPDPDAVAEQSPPSTAGVSCSVMNLIVARTLLDSILNIIARPPQPGFVRVLAFCNGTAFFTHARIDQEA